jgi:hypothetical protein
MCELNAFRQTWHGNVEPLHLVPTIAMLLCAVISGCGSNLPSLDSIPCVRRDILGAQFVSKGTAHWFGSERKNLDSRTIVEIVHAERQFVGGVAMDIGYARVVDGPMQGAIFPLCTLDIDPGGRAAAFRDALLPYGSSAEISVQAQYPIFRDFCPLPRNLPPWLNAFESPDLHGVPTATLVSAMASPEWQVRYYVVNGLYDRVPDDPAALRALAAAIADERMEVRQEVLPKMRALGEDLAPVVSVLTDALMRNPEMPEPVHALRRVGPSAIPRVASLVQPPFTRPIDASAASVLWSSPEASRPYLSVLIQATAAGNRWAAQAACAADTPGTLRQLAELARNDDPAIRRNATNALLYLGPYGFSEPLSESMSAAATSVEALIECVDKRDPATLDLAIRALPWFYELSRPALPALEKLREERRADVSQTDLDEAILRIRETGS